MLSTPVCVCDRASRWPKEREEGPFNFSSKSEGRKLFIGDSVLFRFISASCATLKLIVIEGVPRPDLLFGRHSNRVSVKFDRHTKVFSSTLYTHFFQGLGTNDYESSLT